MTTMYDDVGAFHRKMGLPVAGDEPPRLLSHGDYKYRVAFMQEELAEFIDAHARGDLADALDALVDLAWVALGTAHYMRAPFDNAWQEVVLANMQKRPWKDGDPVKPRNALNVEVVKPPGWRPPDLRAVLENYRATFHRSSR